MIALRINSLDLLDIFLDSSVAFYPTLVKSYFWVLFLSRNSIFTTETQTLYLNSRATAPVPKPVSPVLKYCLAPSLLALELGSSPYE